MAHIRLQALMQFSVAWLLCQVAQQAKERCQEEEFSWGLPYSWTIRNQSQTYPKL